ncbi:MAG: hypothetical protein C0196_02425 [Dictyoglomus turgidum]|nr:MAG: hypothetical protein C0196_02425 [Dictyoglomus turgidum]
MKPDEVYSLETNFNTNIDCNLLICPKDHTALKLLKDPLIPKDVLIYYCENCFGMWVPFQSLKNYKNYQKEKIESKRHKRESEFKEESKLPKDLEQKIDQLLSKDLEKDELEDIEIKLSKLVSTVLLILRILSFFIKR